MKAIENICWHDSVIELLTINFAKGELEIAFIEFGSEISYNLHLKQVVLLDHSLENTIDFENCEISNVDLLKKETDYQVLVIGIYSPMNGFLELKIKCSNIYTLEISVAKGLNDR